MHSTFPPTAYTVGWICVKVTNEAVAARAMLDERHGYIDLSGQGDPIQYFGGRIGKHNVIIGCSGEAGLNPANNVATNMSRSFKNIKVGLLCGMGGGNPSEKHDIRLGDVVVGMPEGQHSGVTQYNAGKTTEDGFLRKASYNRPPQSLIQAVASRKTDLIEGLDTWKKRLNSAPKDWGSFDNLTDILYEGQHKLPRPDNREPKVHYGLIASGDLVVKADRSRRELVQQIQDDVLCFEMEAAGIINTFPCLVVRGISNYSDRYKNDDWQQYASSAAAAYCKYLLEVVHVSDIQVASTPTKIMESGQYSGVAHTLRSIINA
jgi:nucleoside phosphorylase